MKVQQDFLPVSTGTHGGTQCTAHCTTHTRASYQPNRGDQHRVRSDIGATSHVCSDRAKFSSINTVSNVKATWGDDGASAAEGMGSVPVEYSFKPEGEAYSVVLKDGLLFVPAMGDQTPISWSRMGHKGHTLSNEKSGLLEFISNDTGRAPRAQRHQRLYNLNPTSSPSLQRVSTAGHEFPCWKICTVSGHKCHWRRPRALLTQSFGNMALRLRSAAVWKKHPTSSAVIILPRRRATSAFRQHTRLPL